MKHRRPALIVVVAAVLAVVAYSQYWVATGRFGTVEAGRLYRSAELPADRLVDIVRQHRVTTVVDFRREDEGTEAEASTLVRAGVRHVAIPSAQVPSEENVARFLAVMDQSRGQPVLIHCTHGVGRTGVFGAIYRMEYQGWPRWAAIAEAMLYAGFGSFAPWSDKTAFLLAYRTRERARR